MKKYTTVNKYEDGYGVVTHIMINGKKVAWVDRSGGQPCLRALSGVMLGYYAETAQELKENIEYFVENYQG